MDRGRRLDLAWDSAAGGLSAEDRAWVHQLVFGTIRLRGRLDHLLDLHLDRGIESVPIPLLQILRLGAYQLLEMGSVPTYAAVSQAAAQASHEGGTKGAALVNAVLRALAARGGAEDRFPAFEDDPAGHLATWGSHPRWLVERWLSRFGADLAREIVEAGNQVPRLYFRPVGVTLEEARDRLVEAGIAAEIRSTGTATLVLPAKVDPAAALSAAPGLIQDPAASAVVDFVAADPASRIADLCAAPGGKGIALAGLGARVFSLDLSPVRMRLMRGSLRRLRLPERVVVGRAERHPFAPGTMDVILVDAPCTGTGTLARHPDARWRLVPDDPKRLAGVQEEILSGVADLVRPGGVLIYATCTLELEENEDAIEAFLGGTRGFARDGEKAILQLFPSASGGDGAFAARLRRLE